MSMKWLFEGGIPGETHGEGVRRRGKGMLVTLVMLLLAAGVVAFVYSIFGSIWLTTLAAALCGGSYIKLSTPFDLPVTKPSNRSEKLIWLVLFVPPLIVLGATALYEMHIHDVFRAASVAGLFGAVLGGTFMVLQDPDSRARVEGTTFTTSADENP